MTTAWRPADQVLGSIADAFDRISPQPVPMAPEARSLPPRVSGATCVNCGQRDGNRIRHGERKGRGFVMVGQDGLCVSCRTKEASA